MEKGKGKGIWVSAMELFGMKPRGEEEWGKAAVAKLRAPPPRGVDEAGTSYASGSGAGGASSGSAPAAMEDIAPPEAMAAIAPFEDGQYVRLRNRGRGGYLFANETGRGVSVDSRRGMVNTAWAVQILQTARTAHVLLRGAYGRYLSATRNPAHPGLVGYYTLQCIFEFSDDHHILWSVAKGMRGSVVLLQGTGTGARALRANGRYQRWNADVTVGPVDMNSISSMMEWEVQIIPLTVERPPPYHPRSHNAAIVSSSPASFFLSHAVLPGWGWREGCGEEVQISFTDAWFADNGQVEYRCWMDMLFDGRNLIELRNEIANRLGSGVQLENMTLCVQAGNYGRPTPLLTDLPLRDDPVIILVFMVGSPGENRIICSPPVPTLAVF
ncbi:hypothetical protein U9M48_010354 [Paspalum notatum var. saurae]|uniref:DUF569 domain-containing protein n=1 Tax=Paspalum notatum var. saurae TaxID=547442 RepID=A0AAQ3WG25_PASNO